MEVKVLSRPRGFAVVQLSDRPSPGVVLQGETLHYLSKELEEALTDTDEQRRTATLSMAIQSLRQIQTHYEEVLRRENITIPYRS